jgi:hypothetical protein
MADDWRVRVELADEDARRRFARLLEEGLSSTGADRAQELRGHVSVSGDAATLFVYADSALQAECALAVVLAELEHHALPATASGVEHWLADEDRWDNEPRVGGWEDEVAARGFAPWEVRVTCRSRQDAVRLAAGLEDEGYQPVRHWRHLIVGASSRDDADALAERLHGEVEPGGAVVWEEAIDSDLVHPFAFFG